MNGVKQKNFGFFFTACSDMQAMPLLIKSGKSDIDVIKLFLSKFVKAHDTRKK
jgi:hypothetical protein